MRSRDDRGIYTDIDTDTDGYRGFILLDSLIALTLAGLVLAGLLTASRSVREITARTAHIRELRHTAVTLLERLGPQLPVQAGIRQGVEDEGRVRWTLRITPHAEAPVVIPDTLRPQILTLYDVTITAEWLGPPPAAALTLRTRRIGPRYDAGINTGLVYPNDGRIPPFGYPSPHGA